MPLKTSVFIATSLDGYISRKDGSIDWLNAANALVPPGEDCGYSAFMTPIDVCILGRNTYEQVLTFSEWPYGQRKVIVLSSQALQIPELLKATVSASSETPEALFAQLTCTRPYARIRGRRHHHSAFSASQADHGPDHHHHPNPAG